MTPNLDSLSAGETEGALCVWFKDTLRAAIFECERFGGAFFETRSVVLEASLDCTIAADAAAVMRS